METVQNHDTAQRTYHRKRIAYLGAVWVAAGLFLWQAVALPPPSRPTPVSAATFPTIVGAVMVVAATGMLAEAMWAYFRRSRTSRAATPVQEEDAASTGPNGEELVGSPARVVIVLAATVAYVAVFFPLGYLLSTGIFLAGTAAYFWRRPLASVAIAVALTVVIGWLFGLLGITLPPGVLALRF